MPGSSSWMPYAPQGVKGLEEEKLCKDLEERSSYLLRGGNLKSRIEKISNYQV
jgi:hypothetical protein